MKIINHVLNLEIDKFKLMHGRVPSLMRLGRKQLASLLDVDEDTVLQVCNGAIYRQIRIEAVDEDWHLGMY